MAITVTDRQGYARADQPSGFKVLPTQPQLGNRAITAGVAATIFQYDLITPYGVGQSASNPTQATRLMVGWGLKVVVGILCSTNMILTILVNSGVNATFTEIDTSPITITANAKWQFYTSPILACAHARGQLQAAASNSTVEYHVRLLEQ